MSRLVTKILLMFSVALQCLPLLIRRGCSTSAMSGVLSSGRLVADPLPIFCRRSSAERLTCAALPAARRRVRAALPAPVNGPRGASAQVELFTPPDPRPVSQLCTRRRPASALCRSAHAPSVSGASGLTAPPVRTIGGRTMMEPRARAWCARREGQNRGDSGVGQPTLWSAHMGPSVGQGGAMTKYGIREDG